MTYEQVATFAQQAGTIIFSVSFVAALIYIFLPGKKAGFDQAARLPLEEDK
jgi:cytochrome c oxidase cbb3-type subunit 4